jgi:hypothetical protein
MDERRSAGDGPTLRLDLDAQLDRGALDILEHHLPIRRNYGPTDVPVIGAQGCDVSGRFDVNLVTVSQGQASRQGPKVNRPCASTRNLSRSVL